MYVAFLCVGAASAQDASLLPTSLTFSSQTIGTTSGIQTLTLTNTDGANALTISTIVASGDFTQTNTCGSSIAAGASCTISAQFAPTAVGTIDGSISIFDNAPGSPQVLGLIGTGIAQETVSPSSLNFGTVAIGKTSAIKTVKLTNNTTTSVAIASITASGDFSAVPATSGGCGSTLGAGASCTEDVLFTPTELGTVDGSVIFADAGTQQYVTLTGKGSGTADSPITLTPPTLAFGNQTIGSTSVDQSVTIKNTGATSLNLTFAASGSYLKSNPGSGACGSSLAGGASCTIDVQFSPAVLGAIDGGVSISYSGAGSPQVVSLTGTGIGQVTLSPSRIAFSSQQVDTTSGVTKVTVTNNSSSAVSMSSIVPSTNFKETNTCGASIAVGTSCIVSVSFAPTRGGFVTGSLIITDSATNSPQIVDLSGSSFLVSRFAYVANLDSGTVSIYTVNLKTGQLRSNGYVLAGSIPVAVTVEPSGKFAYVANIGSNSISAYAINASTGDLTPIAGSPYATGGNPASVTVDPSGKYVYVPNELSNNISAYIIDGATGVLTPVTGSPFAAGLVPASVAIDPSGRFAYVGNENDTPGGDVSGFTIDATTGALTAIEGSPFLSGSGSAVAVAPSGEFGYVLGEPGTNQITAFSINATTGAPTQVAGSPFNLGEASSASLAMVPSGKFIYVAGGGVANAIVALSVNTTTGALKPVAGSPFPTGDSPFWVTVDPKGTLLYVTNESSNEVWTYTIADNGALTVLNKARTQQDPASVALGGGSASVTYTPTFAYVANNGCPDGGQIVPGTISAYTINASSGHITAVSGSPFAAGSCPQSITTDPSGKFAYVANSGSTTVSAYTINSSSGALTAINGSPFAAGVSPFSVTVDPSGRFAYVANYASHSISAYTINTSTGILTAVSDSPYPTGATYPFGVTVDPTGQFLYVADSPALGTPDGIILAFTINSSSGALTAVSGSPFTAGVDQPDSVTVDPSGRFAYVANDTGGTISAYDIDATTGALSEISGSPFAIGPDPASVTVNPLGNFVYVLLVNDNYVYAYTLDATSGALTQLPDAPFLAGGSPDSVAVDPSGKFVYVANYEGNDVTAYTIDAKTGDLKVISGESGVAAGNNPSSVATTGIIH